MAVPRKSGKFKRVALAALVIACAGAAEAASTGFIAAPGRTDIAYDTQRDILYISGGDSVRRYDMRSGLFLAPIVLGGSTLGMDISPDGKTLAVANTAFGGGSSHVSLVNLDTGASTQVNFNLASGEGGTFAVAYDSAGKLLVSGQYQGSGWVPLRKYDPTTGATTVLGQVRQDSMLSASGDRSVIGVAESNISDGTWGTYRAGDASYVSQHQWYDPVTGGTSWFNFEIGVSRDGSQIAIPTYGGTFIGTAASLTSKIGTYAGITPIGVGYSDISDRVFMPLANTDLLAEYDTTTLSQVATFEAPGTFDWIGNSAFVEGRTKVAGDDSYVFSTLDNGIFFVAAPIPEPSTSALMLLGSALVVGATAKRRAARR